MPSSNRDATNGKDPQGDQGIPSCCVWFAPFGGMWTLIQTLVRHSHISSSGSQRSQRSVPENTTHLMIKIRRSNVSISAKVRILSTGPGKSYQSTRGRSTQITNRQRHSANELHLSLACCPPLCKDLLPQCPVIRQFSIIVAGYMSPVTDSIVADHSQPSRAYPLTKSATEPGKCGPRWVGNIARSTLYLRLNR